MGRRGFTSPRHGTSAWRFGNDPPLCIEGGRGYIGASLERGKPLSWSNDRVGALDDWQRIKLLTVRVDRLRRWYRPGLLCIGNAAHAMSPVGGVGQSGDPGRGRRRQSPDRAAAERNAHRNAFAPGATATRAADPGDPAPADADSEPGHRQCAGEPRDVASAACAARDRQSARVSAAPRPAGRDWDQARACPRAGSTGMSGNGSLGVAGSSYAANKKTEPGRGK